MPDETLTPETIRELAALDAALAGEPVERGFPRRAQGRAVPAPHGAARLRARLSGALRSPVALGSAATVVLAAVVVGISQAPHGTNDGGGSGGGGSAAAPAERSA